MGRKAIDLEKMYQKIMPTYYSEETAADEVQVNAKESGADPDPENINSAILQTVRTQRIHDRDHRVVIENITEQLVMRKLDMVLNKMSCCKCDRCKMDIVSMAMNALEPQYIVAQKNYIDKRIELALTDAFSQRVTSEVLKAALAVRKEPRH